MKTFNDNPEFIKNWGIKKHLHNVHRNNLKKQKKSIKFAKVYVSDVVSLLGSSIANSPNTLRKKSIILHLPETFSLIENPKESLEVILGFAKDARNRYAKEIFYDHSNVSTIDLSAESLLGCIAGEIDKERARQAKLVENGLYPKNKHVTRLIKSVGVIQNLNVTHEFLSHDEAIGLRVYRKRNNSYVRQSSYNTADFKEKTIKDFVNHINNCLHDHGRKLKPEAVVKLVAYTGEIITNAEEHPGYNDWTIIGYLDNKSSNHMCEITIFNFGKSISDTLKELRTDSFTFNQISPYIDAHKRKGLFSTGWNEDDLLTLVALQGNISCKNTSTTDDRGQGTVDLVRFFQKIHTECVHTKTSEAKMAILSGSTYILFDGKYKMEVDSNGRQVIAFNSSNELREVPDRKYVQNLGNIKFPGTIIGIKFPMHIDTHTEEVA